MLLAVVKLQRPGCAWLVLCLPDPDLGLRKFHVVLPGARAAPLQLFLMQLVGIPWLS
jgi:hypothetical protein